MRERDKAVAALDAAKNPLVDVRTIKDRKEYERVKQEALRELARAGYVANPPAEHKDARFLSLEDYEDYKVEFWIQYMNAEND